MDFKINYHNMTWVETPRLNEWHFKESDLRQLRYGPKSYNRLVELASGSPEITETIVKELKNADIEKISNSEKNIYKSILIKQLPQLIWQLNSWPYNENTIYTIKFLAIVWLWVESRHVWWFNWKVDPNTQRFINIFTSLVWSNVGKIKDIWTWIILCENWILPIDNVKIDFLTRIDSKSVDIWTISWIWAWWILIWETGFAFYDYKANKLVSGDYSSFNLWKAKSIHWEIVEFDEWHVRLASNWIIQRLWKLDIWRISSVSWNVRFLRIQWENWVALYNKDRNETFFQTKDLWIWKIDFFSGNLKYDSSYTTQIKWWDFVIAWDKWIVWIDVNSKEIKWKFENDKLWLWKVMWIVWDWIIWENRAIQISKLDWEIKKNIDIKKMSLGKVKSFKTETQKEVNTSHKWDPFKDVHVLTELICEWWIIILDSVWNIKNKINAKDHNLWDISYYIRDKWANWQPSVIVAWSMNSMKINPVTNDVIYNTASISPDNRAKFNSLWITDLNRFYSDELIENIISSRTNPDKLWNKPVTVFLQARADHNQAFSNNIMEKMVKKHDVLYFEIGSKKDLLEALNFVQKLKDRWVEIPLFELWAHSNQFTMNFDKWFNIDKSIRAVLGSYRNLMWPETLFVVSWCEAWRWGENGDNIANLLFNTIWLNAWNSIAVEEISSSTFTISDNWNIIPSFSSRKTIHNSKQGTIYIE